MRARPGSRFDEPDILGRSPKEIQAAKSKTEGEFSELGHQVGAELQKLSCKNWDRRSDLES